MVARNRVGFELESSSSRAACISISSNGNRSSLSCAPHAHVGSHKARLDWRRLTRKPRRESTCASCLERFLLAPSASWHIVVEAASQWFINRLCARKKRLPQDDEETTAPPPSGRPELGHYSRRQVDSTTHRLGILRYPLLLNSPGCLRTLAAAPEPAHLASPYPNWAPSEQDPQWSPHVFP